ncbi:unnamed protein product [Peronospora destructor]|uniref:Uncharacterized protein n=1 Tax=Peronospora destructor TaxID=86335 RepID=A0AAV0U1W9_9STRA|nr:unnamed protein product [Peronospora destructor]
MSMVFDEYGRPFIILRDQEHSASHRTMRLDGLAGALLEEAEKLLAHGLHPMRIVDGLEEACEIACKHLEAIGDVIYFTENDSTPLVETAMTHTVFQNC